MPLGRTPPPSHNGDDKSKVGGSETSKKSQNLVAGVPGNGSDAGGVGVSCDNQQKGLPEDNLFAPSNIEMIDLDEEVRLGYRTTVPSGAVPRIPRHTSVQTENRRRNEGIDIQSILSGNRKNKNGSQASNAIDKMEKARWAELEKQEKLLNEEEERR